MRTAIYGIARNGLDSRTGLAIVATLNLGRHQGAPGVDPVIASLARRISSPLVGGAGLACIDHTFALADRVVWARPGPGCAS